MKVSVVRTHTYAREEVNQKSSEVSSEVSSKIPTALDRPSNHLISYRRSSLRYPFQNCNCRQPNVPSNKLLTVHLQNGCFHLSSQLTTGKLQMQHTQRNFRDLSVTILYRLMKKSKKTFKESLRGTTLTQP